MIFLPWMLTALISPSVLQILLAGCLCLVTVYTGHENVIIHNTPICKSRDLISKKQKIHNCSILEEINSQGIFSPFKILIIKIAKKKKSEVKYIEKWQSQFKWLKREIIKNDSKYFRYYSIYT